MLVTIRLFARLRELAGRAELRRELPDECDRPHTPGKPRSSEFPDLAAYERSLSAAVNADYARFTTKLTRRRRSGVPAAGVGRIAAVATMPDARLTGRLTTELTTLTTRRLTTPD